MKKSLVTGLITLGLAAMLTGCGSSGKTIIDKVAYNTDGTMVAEAKKYLDSKDLIYEEKGGIHNTVADKFLGYRAYYDIDADDYYIYLTFDSEDELTKASKDVKKYFESKEDKDYKKSDLSELVEEKPEIWQEIFDGTTGNVYVVDYKDNKDDSFDYEAVLYCTMSDLDAAKEANGYVMGDLNTYIAISVKGAKGVTTDSINPMASSYEPVMETDSAAVESIETIETAENVDEQVATEPQSTVNAYEMLSECINKWNDIERNAFKYSYGYIGDIPAVFAIEPKESYRIKLLYVDGDKVISCDLGTWKDDTYYYKNCVCGYNPVTNTIIYEETSQVADKYIEFQLKKSTDRIFPEVVKGCSRENDDTFYNILGFCSDIGTPPVYNSMDGTYSMWNSTLCEPAGSGSEAMIEEIKDDVYCNMDVINLGYYDYPTDFMAIKLFDTFDDAYNANSGGTSSWFPINEAGETAPG